MASVGQVNLAWPSLANRPSRAIFAAAEGIPVEQQFTAAERQRDSRSPAESSVLQGQVYLPASGITCAKLI